MMTEAREVMVVVHPGSACGSADFNLGDEAGRAREVLARDIMAWAGDMLVVDGVLSDEIGHYALLAIALENAGDQKEARFVRCRACDDDGEWPHIVRRTFDREWPGGPHRVTVTGAWLHDDGGGCVGAVAEALRAHRVNVADSALRLAL